MVKQVKKRIALLNTLTNLLLQFITIASGFVVPKIILNTFGSETNGLVGSLKQFLNYINLLEGGLNGVIMASLYKPISKKDNKKISSIAKASQHFFGKISIIFILYSIILSIVFPLASNNSFNFGFVSSLTLILSIKLFAQYCFSLTNKNILEASKRGYIIYITQSILLVVETIITVICAKLWPSIHIIKLASAIIYFAQPIVFSRAIKRHFEIDKKAEQDKTLISERWNGLAINIAAFIHNNTDIAVLTILTDLKTVSIYSIYALVSTGLRKIIGSISEAIAPSIGSLYAKGDKDKLIEKFNLFEFIIFYLSFTIFGIGTLLITPFVMLYTKNITDANYYQPLFGIAILASELISVIRAPALRLAYGAGKFKDITNAAIIEASLNIVVSVLLVFKFGLIGVAIGTFVGMGFRTFWQNYYLKDHIINRPFHLFLKRFLRFAIPEILLLSLCFTLIPIKNYGIIEWIKYSLIYSVIFIATFTIVSIVSSKEELISLKNYIKKNGNE